ncbi:MAG: ATP-binding cassette domain-containing protein, partial [Clostridia bacterium]|nr:ATP-binding cassette domain-containing protein [Clostridia bacterium]
MNVIEISQLNFAYDKEPVVKDVTLSVKRGEFVCLLGRNGTGKTTSIRILMNV